MVKLDTTLLPYLSRDDFRTLTAVEMGMRNHELVPRSLVYSISGIKNGSIAALLRNLTEKNFLTYERSKRYDGYRLTYRGYDYLALNVLRNRGVIVDVESQIGVGKEADVYVARNAEGRLFAIKFHRLGRTCFRKVTDKRDYQKKNQSHKAASWIYLSRLAAIREYAFMKLLHERRLLPIPEPIDQNRHCIVMELIDGSLLNHIRIDDIGDRKNIESLYENLMSIIMKLAYEFGVVHGDFNEFNILIRNDGSASPVVIDFPQMISINHELAAEYFDRDVDCIASFFAKRFSYEPEHVPYFEGLEFKDEIDDELKALIDGLNDEEKLMETIQNQNDRKENESVVSKGSDSKIDMMSKFLNSLPNHTIDDNNEQPLYEQMTDELIKEAQEKVMIEGKFLHLNISESNENDEQDTVPPMVDTDSFDHKSVHTYAQSTASTFSPMEIKSRLVKERKKRESRDRMKVNTKNIKGDANALRRRKKNDQALANEDLQGYLNDGGFW
ncbi:hypothetical protein RDWZM_009592 [Blomia tropicalis]|uniref:Serine/threonine-protein kinase RIO2 n=1 Tax=Blomia tropicalis TaxID=40697 RepID=A0A9Q0M6V6_BLOTA|nr:hypothetical protein RDWZM_009592 [Blomia tropicalis]